MVLADQLAVGTLDLGELGLRADAQGLIRVGQTVCRRRAAAAAATAGSAHAAGTQHGFQLPNFGFRKAQSTGNPQQHLMLGRMNRAIGRDGLQLHLQEQLVQNALSAAGGGEVGHLCIQVEAVALAAPEGLFGGFPRRATQVEAVEQRFGEPNFLLADPAVGFAQSAHDCEGGIEESRLQLLHAAQQFAHQLAMQPVAHKGAEQSAAEAAEGKADQAAENDGEVHGASLKDAGRLRPRWACLRSRRRLRAMNKHENPLVAVRQWLERVVIGERLCPFAAQPFRQGRVAFRHSEAGNDEALLLDLHAAASELLASPPDQIETTVLVLTEHLRAFEDYNDFLDLADALLAQQGWDGDLQIASFHPDYRFADAPGRDRSHWTNRAPWPLLHLLREASVETALDHHPDPDAIPARNIRHLRTMDPQHWAELFGTPPPA